MFTNLPLETSFHTRLPLPIVLCFEVEFLTLAYELEVSNNSSNSSITAITASSNSSITFPQNMNRKLTATAVLLTRLID